jgi:MoaA/NifB/PqqE/SkfB family radical SAM enzyme
MSGDRVDGEMSGYLALEQLALEKGIPLSAHIELTRRCRWRCLFCYSTHGRPIPSRVLRLDEWIRILDELRVLGTLSIAFTGGDPLEHPAFFEIAEAARARAFALRILTNGSRLGGDVPDRVAALRPLSVEMSLHGSSAAAHDAVTRREGSFAEVWSAAAALRERNVPILLKTLLTSLSAPQLDEIIELAARRGVPLRVDPMVSPCDDGDRGPLRFRPPRRAVERLMGRLAEEGRLPTVRRRRPNQLNCGVGRTTIAIDSEGRVYPCPLWRAGSLGDVRARSLPEMWRDSPVREEASAVSVRANEMLREAGGALARFPFCPAFAHKITGDPLGLSPAFTASARAAEKARVTRS